MPRLQISEFAGIIPRRSPTMLRENDAQVAENTKLYAGELGAWLGPDLVYAPTNTDAETIFLLRNTANSQSRWLTWSPTGASLTTSGDVDVVRSPLTDTSDFRVYYTGDGAPKKSNWTMSAAGTGAFPQTSYPMGVTAPTGAPTLTDITAAGTVAETRYYVYTNVATFGAVKEESAPSPARAITIAAGEGVAVTGFTAAPSGQNVTHRRIYRTAAASSSVGTYAFVAEIPVATTTYNDTLKAISLGEALPSIGWSTPPAGMTGLTAMANGMLAGFLDNTVYFCEPYTPHAWPDAYGQTVPHRIVGLASYGNTLVVMTDGNPYLMSGSHPDTITVERIPLPEPCVSKRSIVSDGYGVVYASPNGLVSIGNSFRGVLTNELFRRDEWQKFNPASLVATIHDGRYYAAFSSSTYGSKTLVVSRDDVPTLCFLNISARDFAVDDLTGDLYYLAEADGKIYKFNSDATKPLTYQWRSKRFVLPQGMTFSAIKLDLDRDQAEDATLYNQLVDEISTTNQAIFAGGATDLEAEVNSGALNSMALNHSILQPLPTSGDLAFCNVLIFGERNALVAALTITDFSPRRLPPFRARELEILIVGNLRIRSLRLATTVQELADGA